MHAEDERLNTLRSFCVMDTPQDERFDRVTAMVADLFEVPVALVSLVDGHRQWFKSRHGLEATQTPRSMAFCAHVLDQGRDAVLIVEDATQDPRFADNPLVTGGPKIRFYVGAALTAPNGCNLGTLCMIDTKPRPRPSDREIGRLQTLARIVVDELELGKAMHDATEQQRFLTLAETASGVGHWRYHAAEGRVEWSDEVFRIHGVDRDSFDPNYGSALSFYHPDDRPTVAATLQRAVDEGVDFEFQLRMIRADGSPRLVMSRGSRHGSGDSVTVIGVFQDVTDQVESLEAIQKSEARFRLLTESANDVVLEIAPDSRITYVSPSVAAMTGHAPEAAVGRSVLELAHPDDRDVAFARFEESMVRGGGWPVEFRIPHADGSVRWVEARPTAVRDAKSGKLLCITDVLRDITTRKAMETELRAAKAEAEAAAAVKSEFLANMSHEIRTPLSSILGFSELLKPHVADDETARRYLERSLEAGSVLLATVNDVLDFSKLEAGQVRISQRPVEPRALADGIAQLLAPQAQSKALALTCHVAGDVPELVWLDDTRVRQILINLVGNAVKFTRTGGIDINVSFDAGAERMRYEVADTGDGIPADRMDRLFKRFSQVDASTTREHGGTGLGLVICKGLVEAMGGAIGVDSRLGEGTTFWFELPCPPIAADTAPAAANEPIGLGAFAALKLLVVDDNPRNRELVRLLMSVVGCEACEAASGEEAIALAEHEAFDVILMDVQMPGLCGTEAAGAIRRGGGVNRETPIIAFTAEADAGSSADAWGEVFAGVVAKPIVADALYATLAEVVWPQPEAEPHAVAV